MAKDIRELDLLVAKYVLDHEIISLKKGGFREKTAQGAIRPLRAYSADIAASWEVIQRLGMLVIPIADGSWFTLVGEEKGWKSPADLIQFLQTADFATAGAAVADTAPLAVCLAALKAIAKRKKLHFEGLAEFMRPAGGEETGQRAS